MPTTGGVFLAYTTDVLRRWFSTSGLSSSTEEEEEEEGYTCPLHVSATTGNYRVGARVGTRIVYVGLGFEHIRQLGLGPLGLIFLIFFFTLY